MLNVGRCVPSMENIADADTTPEGVVATVVDAVGVLESVAMVVGDARAVGT